MGLLADQYFGTVSGGRDPSPVNGRSQSWPRQGWWWDVWGERHREGLKGGGGDKTRLSRTGRPAIKPAWGGVATHPGPGS